MATKPNQALTYRRVPAYLRRLREEAELTQRALAQKLGRSQWWVHRNETGSRRLDVAEFVEWCGGCGIDPAEAIHDLRRARGG